MPDTSAERTEPATAKKRQDERKKGNIFMSKDVNTLVSLIVSFYAFSLFVERLLTQVQVYIAQQIERVSQFDVLYGDEVLKIFRDGGVLIATTVLPAMMIAGLASIVATMAQTRGLVTQESMKFKMSRINLLKGIKRFFSLRSIVELVKSLIKIVVLIWIIYLEIRDTFIYIPNIIDWDILQALVFMGQTIMAILKSVIIAFIVLAAFDFFYQRWEYEKNIRMTKQEIKDEWKNMEGDPQIKSKRRQKQQEMAQMRMMQAVKDADVIVRNPTHYAVALKYTIDKDPAPMVLAKGKDAVALRIVEEGEKHKVMTVENKSLARGLYEASDVFGFIPPEFFQPVAELLAWIYSTRENAGNSIKLPPKKQQPAPIPSGMVSASDFGPDGQ